MLVLSRKAQQAIRIGDSVTVTILRVKGNSVRIGIEAPQETRIVRAELPDFGKDELPEADQKADATDHVTAVPQELSQQGTTSRRGNRIQRFVDGPKPPVESILSTFPTRPAPAGGIAPASATSRPR